MLFVIIPYLTPYFIFLLFFVLIILGVILALWSNETDKKSLSKVVQEGRKYLQLDFQKDWTITYGVIGVVCDSTIFYFSFYFSFFFIIQIFLGVILALWLNKTDKKSLSKVVQEGRKYL